MYNYNAGTRRESVGRRNDRRTKVTSPNERQDKGAWSTGKEQRNYNAEEGGVEGVEVTLVREVCEEESHIQERVGKAALGLSREASGQQVQHRASISSALKDGGTGAPQCRVG